MIWTASREDRSIIGFSSGSASMYYTHPTMNKNISVRHEPCDGRQTYQAMYTRAYLMCHISVPKLPAKLLYTTNDRPICTHSRHSILERHMLHHLIIRHVQSPRLPSGILVQERPSEAWDKHREQEIEEILRRWVDTQASCTFQCGCRA